MGLTIHYTFRPQPLSAHEAQDLMQALRRSALHLPFQAVGPLIDWSVRDGESSLFDLHGDCRWLLIQAGRFVCDEESHFSVLPERLFAFTTAPGDGSEPANFGLGLYPRTYETPGGQVLETGFGGWTWSSFCKTQYASNPECGGAENFVRCHTSIVRLLDAARELGLNPEVYDESDFWIHRNEAALAAEVGRWNRLIAGFAGRLQDELGVKVDAEIIRFPNFEHLEAEGRRDELP